MNNVKNLFSIKDLENFSGIKAHTIRIWEKRYGILKPYRSDTNIREYDIEELKKLLNITLLHDYGYKISKISEYNEEKIIKTVKEIINEKSIKTHAINAFKLAMINFDHLLFFETYNKLLANKSFREIFFEVVIPLMNEIGYLWQVDSISAAHEHFLTYLIKQKLLTNTESIQKNNPTRNDRVFVLYLPENEIHELGLMFLNYEILFQGYKTIYLGESVPMINLKSLHEYFDKITFVTYLTVEPTKDMINAYIVDLKNTVLKDLSDIWILGSLAQSIDEELITNNICIFNSIEKFIDKIENL